MKKWMHWLLLSGVLLFAVGCSNSGTERKVAEAREVMEKAIAAGAELSAPIPLQNARQKIEDAERFMQEGKTDSALTAAALASEAAKEAMKTTEEANSIPRDGY